MKLTMKIGSLAIVGLFSAGTLAQVAVRPRPAPTEVRPVEVRPNVAPSGQTARGRFDSMNTGAPAASSTQQRADSCSRDNDISKLVQRTGLNQGIVETGMKQLVVQGCQAGPRGFLDFESNDAVKIAVLTGYYIEQNKLDGAAALAKAQGEVKGIRVSADDARTAYQALLQGNAEGCNVFKRTN